MSLIYNVEPESLPTVMDNCNCFVNTTKPTVMVENISSTNNNDVFVLFRLSYMWYSFFGCALTIIFGLIISIITEKIAATRIFYLTKHQKDTSSLSQPQSILPPPTFNSIDNNLRKSTAAAAGQKKAQTAVFIVETYRKKSQTSANGFDNVALRVDEA